MLLQMLGERKLLVISSLYPLIVNITKQSASIMVKRAISKTDLIYINYVLIALTVKITDGTAGQNSVAAGAAIEIRVSSTAHIRCTWSPASISTKKFQAATPYCLFALNDNMVAVFGTSTLFLRIQI